MDNARKQDIKEKARYINRLSEQFQLVHATYAVQEHIEKIVREYYQEKLRQLKKRIALKLERGLDAGDELKEKAILEEDIKKKRFPINIGYISISDENLARIVKVNNSFTIYLAASLRNTIFNKDGEYNYEVINKIRHLMGHELGHLVLHTKELLDEEGTQGSWTIRDIEKESEANLFEKELLELRKERNKKIRSDGGADKLF